MQIPDSFSDIKDFLQNKENLASIAQATIWIVLGFIFASIISSLVKKAMSKYASLHHTTLVGKIAYYVILALFTVPALSEFNMEVGTLLGAAGILTAAVAFASQAPMTNLISGLCLIIEKPFEIGDILEFDNMLGEIVSIDLLSIKLRTFSNTCIRIPNEILLKSKFINQTRFPIRRYDMIFNASFGQEISALKKALFDVAFNNSAALETPAPELQFVEFGEFAMQLRFTVWVKTQYYLDFKNIFPMEIQAMLKERGIEIPVPLRDVYQRTHPIEKIVHKI